MIFHLDLDSFFVSAERLENPKLIGIPMAVGGRSNRGVLSSASYEARKYGIRSAMPTVQALRILPSLVIVPGNYKLYSKLSKQVFEIVARFAPDYEVVSVDEAYLDMRGTKLLYGSPIEAAEKIRATIFNETKLTASIGIASNRRVAKIATDTCKPNGIRFVPEGEEKNFLAPLDLKRVPGIGPSTEAMLASHGLFKIKDLQSKWTEESLVSRFGEGTGGFLWRVSQGLGSKKFHEESKTRGMSRETTFSEDIRDFVSLKKVLWELVSEVGEELRSEEDPKIRYAHTVKLKLRYPDFTTLSRSRVLGRPTRVDSEIFEALVPLVRDAWDGKTGVRLIGAGVELGDGRHQMDLFRPVDPRAEVLDEIRDEIRSRFGKKAMKTGRDF